MTLESLNNGLQTAKAYRVDKSTVYIQVVSNDLISIIKKIAQMGKISKTFKGEEMIPHEVGNDFFLNSSEIKTNNSPIYWRGNKDTYIRVSKLFHWSTVVCQSREKLIMAREVAIRVASSSRASECFSHEEVGTEVAVTVTDSEISEYINGFSREIPEDASGSLVWFSGLFCLDPISL